MTSHIPDLGKGYLNQLFGGGVFLKGSFYEVSSTSIPDNMVAPILHFFKSNNVRIYQDQHSPTKPFRINAEQLVGQLETLKEIQFPWNRHKEANPVIMGGTPLDVYKHAESQPGPQI